MAVRSPSPFPSDPRANRLADWAFEEVAQKNFLLLRGSTEICRHVLSCCSGARTVQLRQDHRPHWSHRILLADGPTEAAHDLLELLRSVLVLCVRDSLDGAVALDFYKQPSPLAPELLVNTPTAELVRKVKYNKLDHVASQAAGTRLCAELSQVVSRHSWLNSASHVLPVPGHTDSGEASASVRIGHTVCHTLNRRLARVRARQGFRLSAKDMSDEQLLSLADEFIVDEDLTGRTVLVVDDVYHTGSTMVGVANAARRAGAVSVLGLVAVRNLRY